MTEETWEHISTPANTVIDRAIMQNEQKLHNPSAKNEFIEIFEFNEETAKQRVSQIQMDIKSLR